MRVFFFLIAAGILGILADAAPARAFHYYIEGAGGISRVATGTSFYDSPGHNTVSSGQGMGLQLTLEVGLNSPQSAVHFHLGAQHRLSALTSGKTTYGLQATYPLLRMEWQRLYVGAGVTPLVWRRVRDDTNLDFFNRASSTLGILGQAGFLFPITPEIAFFLEATFQRMNESGHAPTAVFTDYVIGFRLYYGDFKGKAPSHGDFKGFRYPHGWTRN